MSLVRRRWLLPVLSLAALDGCSTIQSWFPDKGRDYQFTTEIPELVIPSDLQPGNKKEAAPVSRAVAATSAPSASAARESSRDESQAEARRSARTAAAQRKSEDETADTDNAAEQNQTKAESAATSNASSLQIDQDRTQASRLVAKALTRQKLEIVERNVDKGFFYIKFDPNAVEFKDDDFSDELDFLFGEDPSKEDEYRVNLRQIGPQLSEVTIEDSAGKALSNKTANTLLRLITEAIKQEVPETKAAQPANAEQKVVSPETDAAQATDKN